MVDSVDFDGDPKDYLDFFDFPLEDVDGGSEKDFWNGMQSLELPSDMSMCFSSSLCGGIQNDFSDNKNLSLSYDRTCRLNEFPSAAETTFSGGVLLSDDSSDVKPMLLFKTSSPVSILESSSYCFAENLRGVDSKPVVPVKRARTKRSRSRPSNFSRLRTLPHIWAISERLHPSAASESDPRNHQIGKVLKPAKRTQKKKRASPHLPGVEMGDSSLQQTGETKRCSHCEVTSTPQWREGPMGPKTLCNACGVRYRSGRLFPEYRPAASPTFVSSVHSNSHKKVIEMRNKASHGATNSRASVQLYCRSQSGNSVRQLIV